MRSEQQAEAALIEAMEKAYRLLQADDPTGALAQLPAGGVHCEELVEQAVEIIRSAISQYKKGQGLAKHVFDATGDGENCAKCGANWRDTSKHLTMGELSA